MEKFIIFFISFVLIDTAVMVYRLHKVRQRSYEQGLKEGAEIAKKAFIELLEKHKEHSEGEGNEN